MTKAKKTAEIGSQRMPASSFNSPYQRVSLSERLYAKSSHDHQTKKSHPGIQSVFPEEERRPLSDIKTLNAIPTPITSILPPFFNQFKR